MRRANRQGALIYLHGLLGAPSPPLNLVSDLCSIMVGKDAEVSAMFPVAEVWQGPSIAFFAFDSVLTLGPIKVCFGEAVVPGVAMVAVSSSEPLLFVLAIVTCSPWAETSVNLVTWLLLSVVAELSAGPLEEVRLDGEDVEPSVPFGLVLRS